MKMLQAATKEAERRDRRHRMTTDAILG